MVATTSNGPAAPAVDWEDELAALLAELSSAQDELLAVLVAKKDCLAAADLEALSELQIRELALGVRLQACHVRRGELLAAAKEQNLPGDSIGRLAATLPARQRDKLGKQVKDSQARMRLLQNQSITNWVLAQRSLLHVSQLLEIIATGGRLQPTYGEGETVHSVGSLVNQEA
ncbi:MAG: flagellar export chaperone FlgN [Pirellulaceae bacterium]